MSDDPNPGTEPALRLEWRSPAELDENPANWRRHPEVQIEALSDVIEEVGWAGACLYNETTGRLIDGHARRKIALARGAEKIPVLVGRWSPEQEAKILATLDPLSALAEADAAKLDALLKEVQTDSQAVAELLDSLAHQHGLAAVAEEETPSAGPIPEKYQILVDCESEEDQVRLLERFAAEGLKVRSLIS